MSDGRTRRAAFAVVAGGALAAMVGDVTSSHAAASSSKWVQGTVQWVHFVVRGGLDRWARRAAARNPTPARRRAGARGASVLHGCGRRPRGRRRHRRHPGGERGRWMGAPGRHRLRPPGAPEVVTAPRAGRVRRDQPLPARTGGAGVAAWPSAGGHRRAGGGGGRARRHRASSSTCRPGGTPKAAALETVKPVRVTGADFGTTTRVTLEATPGTVGSNRFVVRVSDYDSGAPVAVDSIRLRFTPADRPDVGESVLELPRVAPGRFAASGTNLSLDGRWNVTVLVPRGVEAVEVPLELTTSRPTQKVDVQPHARAADDLHGHAGGHAARCRSTSTPGSRAPTSCTSPSSTRRGAERPVDALSGTATGPGAAPASDARASSAHGRTLRGRHQRRGRTVALLDHRLRQRGPGGGRRDDRRRGLSDAPDRLTRERLSVSVLGRNENHSR